MTMSWLAEKNATSTAMSAVQNGAVMGSVRLSPTRLAATPAWNSNAQDRRRPSAAVRPVELSAAE